MNLSLTMTAARMAFSPSAVPAAFIALTHKIAPACSAPAPTLRKPSQHANPPAGFLCMSILFETTEVIILNANIIALSNQKGGTGKTTTCANLGIGLAQEGKRVLVVDNDPQASLTISLGWTQPDKLPVTLSTLMGRAIMDEPIRAEEAILHHSEGVDVLPASIELSGMEVSLVNAISRESVLRQGLEELSPRYDHMLIDCMPSLGMITLNALTAADEVIIPVQAQYLPAKGMTQLMKSISLVKSHTNENLKIAGIVMTLVDSRTNLAKDVIDTIRTNYGMAIKIFDAQIPIAVKAAEAAKNGQSIFAYDRCGKPAKAYGELVKETI